jgi:hypothetical protein
MIINKLNSLCLFLLIVGVFGVSGLYSGVPMESQSEFGERATQGIMWNFELRNKNNYRLFFSLESLHPRRVVFVYQKEVGPGQNVRFAFEPPLPFKRSRFGRGLTGYFMIKIWTHDILHKKPDIVKILTIEDKTIFLSFVQEELLPQKGVLGSTQSGLSLKNNITQGDIHSEDVLKYDIEIRSTLLQNALQEAEANISIQQRLEKEEERKKSLSELEEVLRANQKKREEEMREKRELELEEVLRKYEKKGNVQ